MPYVLIETGLHIIAQCYTRIQLSRITNEACMKKLQGNMSKWCDLAVLS